MTPIRTLPALTVAIAALFLVAACGDSGTEPPPVEPVPTELVSVAGEAQEGDPGETLPDSIRVRVLDQNGAGMAGVTVQFVVVSGGGTASPASAETNAQGTAATSWTLGPQPGDNVLEARVSGLTGSPATFSATALEVLQFGTVTGTVTAENGETPIPGATVTVLTNGASGAPALASPRLTSDVPSTTTDSEGRFTLEGVPAGEQTIVARKGVFEAIMEVEVIPGEIVAAGIFPLAPTGKLGYVDGVFDSIEDIIRDQLGSDIEQIQMSDLASAEVTSQFRIIFLNCGSDIDFFDDAIMDNLRDYVQAGGGVYMSDLEIGVLFTMFPEAILEVGGGEEGTVQAELDDEQLRVFARRDSVEIVYNLSGWATLQEISETPKVLVRGDYETYDFDQDDYVVVEDGPLAISFELGAGQVVYTTFHNNAAATEDQIAVLSYFVYGFGSEALAAHPPFTGLRLQSAGPISAEHQAAHRLYRERVLQR